MQLIAGREQIVSRTLPVDKGLYALVHEGGSGRASIRMQTIPWPEFRRTVEVVTINAARSGMMVEGDYALINAVEKSELLTVLIGEPSPAASNMRLVALDKSARLNQLVADPETARIDALSQPPPEVNRRAAHRLLALAAGTHLIRFARTKQTQNAQLVLTCMDRPMPLLISGAPAGTTDLTPGQVAVVDAASGGELMLTLVTRGVRMTDFAGVTIEPLTPLLQRLRRRPAPPPRVPEASPVLQPATRLPITGFRVVWPNRPLGLDMALNAFTGPGALVGQSVMTSSWIRSVNGQPLTGVRCSLIGVNRAQWTMQVHVVTADGKETEYRGVSVDVPGTDTPFVGIEIRVRNAQGDTQALSVTTESR